MQSNLYSNDNIVRQYRVLKARSTEELQDKVQFLINKGWQPLGPPDIQQKNGWTEIHQALTHDKTKAQTDKL